MAFTQLTLERSVDQSRGIFNKYIYGTDDTIAEVQATDYFIASRFKAIDLGDPPGESKWVDGIIECECSDGYFIGRVQASGNTIVNISTSGGFAGEGFFFKNISSRDSFFNTPGNEKLLFTDILAVVNQGNAVTTFVWTGVDQPDVYDADLFIEQDLNSGPGSLFLGLDGSSISSAGKGINFNSAYGNTSLALGTFFDNRGSVKHFVFQFEKEITFVNADVFDTQLIPGSEQNFNFTAVGTTYTQALNIRPATTGTLRIRGYAGTDDTFPIVEDSRITIGSGDIGNIVSVPITGLLVVPGTELFLTFTGIDLFGGLQTSGDFSGQTKAFLESGIDILSASSLITEEDIDQYALLNRGHTAASVKKNGGLVVNTRPTATKDTFTDATFTAGVASTSNPSVPTIGTGIFSAGEFVLFVHDEPFTAPSANSGVYEVLSHASNILTIRGVGTTATVEDFTKDQFVSQESTGTITKIGLSVLRLTNLVAQIGFGDTAPLTFNTVQTLDSVLDLIEFSDDSTQTSGATPDGIGWHTGTLAFKNSKSVSPPESQPKGMFVRPNGANVYICGDFTDEIHQLDLSTRWDVLTITNPGFNVPAEGSNPRAIFWSPSGTDMLVIRANNTIVQFSVNVAWDINAASENGMFSMSGLGVSTPTSWWWHPSGLRFYVRDSSNNVKEFIAANSWDINTAPTAGKTFDAGFSGGMVGFDPTGRIMYLSDSINIYEYDLSSWDLDTPNLISSTAHGLTAPNSITLKPDGTKFFALDNSTDRINEFTLGTRTSNLLVEGDFKSTGGKFEAAAKQVIYSANYVIRNPGQPSTTAETVGRVDVYQKTSITDTITDKQFTADPTNPLIEIDSTSKFSADDIVVVEGTKFNDGIYEVNVQLGFVIFARSVTSKVEDFTNGNVVTAIETGTVTKVEVSVWRTSTTGQPEHGRGNSTPIVYEVLAHASDVPTVATEEFANSNVRFFSELGLPAIQGWTDTETVNGTITIFADSVFGVQKDVIKYDVPASGDVVKSEFPLTAADWINILTFGMSYSGVCRITKDVSTQSIFSGAGFAAGNDPRPSSTQSRVGVFISVDATHTTIRLDGESIVVLDGTGGNPEVLKDEWFSWEIFIDPTPDAGTNFGAATMFVNGVSVVVGGIISSNDSVNDEVSVANSSSTGSTTFYFDNFGATIYEEVATKTLAVATMAANVAQVFIPGGKRDYTVILPDGNPRALGDFLDFTVQNIGGKLKVQTQNTSVPTSLFNGLNELEKEVVSVSQTRLVNTVEGGNIYVEDSEILNQDSLGAAPGSVNYDPVKGTMNVRNIFPGSSVQVGQESVVFVVNNTGASVPDGKVVNITGYDATNDAMEISLALADKVEATEVLGMTTTSMADGAVGLITVFGRVNDLDTTSFSAGEIVYLSDTVAGDITATRPAIPIQIGHVGKIDASIGFIQIEIRELERSIFGGYSHTLDQTFTANVSAPIQFNKNEEFSGIAHSETVDNDEFTFTSGGVYQATAEPQYTRTTGGGTDVLNMFVAKDIGSGFVNVPDSNVKFSVNTAGNTTVSPLTTTFRVDADDKIRFMVQVESANLILDAFPASGSAPNDIPLTPSIIMNIVRIGD